MLKPVAKRSFNLSSIFAIGVAVLISVSIGGSWWFVSMYKNIKLIDSYTSIAGAFENGANQLTTLTGEYLLYQEIRAKEQWRQRHNSMGILLKKMGNFDLSYSLSNDSLGRDYLRSLLLFEKVIKLSEELLDGRKIDPAYQTMKKRIAGELLIATQYLASQAAHSSKIARLNHRQSNKRAMWAIASFFIFLTTVLTVLWSVMAKRVILPIRNLRDGIQKFEGNRKKPLELINADEIGDVTTSFNDMAEKLDAIFVSRNDLAKEVGIRKQTEVQLLERTRDLGERIKELTGLYSISQILNFSDAGFEERIQKTADALTAAWQYPEITCSRITLNDLEVTTKNFKETVWRQNSDITIREKKVGGIEVFYLEEKAKLDEGPFLKEERNLINEIAKKIGQDVDRREATDHIRRLSQVVEQTPSAVIITDTNGIIEYSNNKFTEITGYSAEEVIGQYPSLLKSGETPDAVYEKLWATITSGNVWHGTLRNKRKNGSVYLSGASVSPIVGPDGTITRYLGATQDITQRVEDENRLKQAEKMESLGGLAGGIAHDFNNMLLPILALTDMTRKALPEDSRDRIRLDKVVSAANRAKELVAKILTFSRREQTRLESINIHASIQEALELLRSTLPATVRITDNLKLGAGTVLADRAQIISVVMNLASNSADAMDGHAGEMKVSLSPFKVSKKKAASIQGLNKGKYAKLVVKDNGCGMDKKALSRARDPFFTTKGVGKGTGLGLSMVHGIISKHGGALDISSTPGKGTKVEIFLPLVEGKFEQKEIDS